MPDEPDDEQTFKEFQFGGPDSESVILPGEDAGIGNATNTIDGLHEARRTARLPENEDFVSGLEEALRGSKDRLQRGIALYILSGAFEVFGEAVERAEEKGDPEPFEESVLFERDEEDWEFAAAVDLEQKAEDWQDDPPAFFRDTAEEILVGDGDRQWGKWAEWTATHVMFWAARDVNKQFWEEGTDPENVPEEEWDRRFNEQLTAEEYFADAVQILARDLSGAVVESMKGKELSIVEVERLFGLHEDDEDDAPAPRPSPNPFDIATGVATLPNDPATRSNLKGISGEGDWGEDSFGRPVYRYTIEGPPWGGNAQLSVKEAIEAETAWKMLRDGKGEERPAQFHADAVALYMLFLAYAGDQAPENRPGENGEFRIRGEDAFRVLNLPAGWGLQKKVRHVHDLNSYLNSFQIQLNRVTYEGQKKRTDAISPAQLWDTYLRGVQEEDLHGNVTNIEFWIEGREGAWADLFLHGDEWTPWSGLPIRMLEEMDGRNRFNRLILFRVWSLFRVEKGTVKRTGDDLLKWCRVVPDELSRQTVSRRRSTILNALEEIKQKGFHIDDSRLRAAQGAPLEDWQGQPVYFYPPEEIVDACPQVQAPKGELPEPRSEVWTGKRVRALRKHIGETQGKFGKRLPNREGGRGVKQPRVSTIEQGNHSLTERQEEELDEMAEHFGFEG
jgi:hypothetical protein